MGRERRWPVTALQRLRGNGRGWVLVVVSLGWMAALGTRVVVPAVLPQVKATFGISNAVAGAAVSVMWLGYAGMQFPAGMAIDRTGERTLLLVGAGVGLAGVLLLVSAPLFGVFLAAAALYGLAAGTFGPTRATITAALYPDNDRFALGVVLAAGNLAAAVLPVVAGYVTARFGWRVGVATVLPLFVGAFVGVRRAVPARSRRGSGGTDAARVALSKVFDAVRHRRVLLVGAATVVTVFAYQGFTAFFPTFLVSVRGVAPTVAAGLFGLFFAVSAVTQPLAGAVADRYGDRVVMLGLTALHAAGLLALPFVTSTAGLVLLAVVLGFRGGLGTVNNAYLVAAFPDDVEGGGYGLVRGVYMGIGALGPVVVGALFDAGLYEGAFVLLAGVVAVAVPLYLRLPASPP